jgi:hypothetical protein
MSATVQNKKGAALRSAPFSFWPNWPIRASCPGRAYHLTITVTPISRPVVKSANHPPKQRRFSIRRLRRTRDFSMRTARCCRCSRIPNSPRPLLIFVAKPAKAALPEHWSRRPRLHLNSHSIAPTSAARSRAFWQSPANRDATMLQSYPAAARVTDLPKAWK